MKAAILTVGDELLLGEKMDTNGPWLARELLSRGVVTCVRTTLGDDRAALAAALRALAGAHELVLVTGGLGPTDDDLTREAVADVTDPGQPLVEDPAARAALEAWFAGRDRAMPESNLRQVQRPASCRCLANPRGTAPGLAGKAGDCFIFALPGPPREMQGAFEDHVVPVLPPDLPGLATETVHAFGLGEAAAAERLGDLLRQTEPSVGITASGGILSLRIRGQQPAVEDVAREAERAWGSYVFGRGDATLAGAVIARLKSVRPGGGMDNGGMADGGMDSDQARTPLLTVAESCTGGWIAKLLVDEAGASEYFERGWVTYSNAAKANELGVPEELILAHGAVSRPVAEAMARGALERAGATIAIAVTGIAGPGGGSPEKPVGLVWIAVARDDAVDARAFHFIGDRTMIRRRAALTALQMIRCRRHPLLGEVSAVPGGGAR